LYVGSKYYVEYYDATKFVEQEKPLPHFSVVVAEPGAILVLKNGREFSVSQKYKKDAVSNLTPFVVRNDTLYMLAGKLKIQDKWFTVPEVYCKNVKSIIVREKAIVTLDKFQANTLNITMNKSRLDWRFDSVSFVSIQAKDSDIYLNGKKLKNLAVKLDKTNITVYVTERIDKLLGSLKDGCLGNFAECNSIRLDADKTSDYSFVILGNHSN
ncbi:hypothetical protein, partial [Flavobacterium sp.]|uniref:hypothetical protein n=1 Tax=Flavobacterium sp. TaxID=239 RepID=UPI001B3E02E1